MIPTNGRVRPEGKMIQRKSWKQFRATGLLLFINGILHAFGWVLVVQLDDKGEVIEMFPARTRFRGFDENDQAKSHKQIAKYLAKEAPKFPQQIED